MTLICCDCAGEIEGRHVLLEDGRLMCLVCAARRDPEVVSQGAANRGAR